jgi:hypothetical protein
MESPDFGPGGRQVILLVLYRRRAMGSIIAKIHLFHQMESKFYSVATWRGWDETSRS